MSDPPTLEPAAPDPSGRLAPGERVGVLWLLTLLGIGVSIMVGSLYASLKLVGSPTTTPTTQMEFTPWEMVGLNVTVPLAVAVALVAANAMLRPSGLARVGLTWRQCASGLIIGFLAALVVVPLVHASGAGTEKLWQQVGLKHPTAHPLLRAGAELSNSGLRALIALSAIVLAPLGEELLFRGHLQTAMAYTFDRTGVKLPARGAAILLTSAVFTIFHGELWMMPPIFLLSLCLGYVYERTNNLWAPMIIHALFNASSVVYFFYL
jgi:membrane protease YdiL (CAAX protease family)